MFKCAITGEFSKPNEKPVRLVIERRARTYMASEQIPRSKRAEEFKGTDLVVGHGWEVVTEVNVTLRGLGIWCDHHPDDVEAQERYVGLVRAREARRKLELREGVKVELQ